jgi:hypothetical protein
MIMTVLATGGLLRACSSDPPPPTSSPTTDPGLIPVPEGSTLIASLTRDIDAYSQPGGSPTGTVAAQWHDRASALPVIDQEPGWLRVRLAPRPNGSTAWVRLDDVKVSLTPYRIEVNVATTRLRLFQEGTMVLDAPAGVGREATPTTIGPFFVAFFQEAPGAGWGPFVLVTSGHSDTISDWQESGDAVIAIHGPLGSDDAIGDDGAKLSNGCVRLHLDDITALRDVPAGTPVDIVDSPSAT